MGGAGAEGGGRGRGGDLEKGVVDVAVTGSRGGRRGGRRRRKVKLILHSIRLLYKLRICTGRNSREFILGLFRRLPEDYPSLSDGIHIRRK